ncbi:TonB-dependent receptor domain-containing protein [Gemmatimonadota bacterium]
MSALTRGPQLRLAVLSFMLFLIVAVSTSAFAQEQERTGNIRGYVHDAESGEALPFANVIIKGTTIGAMTATNGYFVIVSAPTRVCSLQVTYIGYEDWETVVDNRLRDHEPLQVRMNPQVLAFEGVTVTAYREEILQTNDEVSQVVLAPSQLTTLPNIGEVDIFRSLQLLPGISGANDGSSGLFVRGGTPDQNLVLFDGMTIYHVDHFFGFFSAFNAEAVKNVQVWKGGFPAKYGGRLSSVVNLTGNTGDRNRMQLGLGANLLSAHTSFEYPLSDRITFLVAARRSYSDFIGSSLYDRIYDTLTGDDSGGSTGGPVQGGRGGRQDIFSGDFRPDFYFYDLNSKLTWHPGERDILSISFYNGADHLDKSQDFSGVSFQRPGGGTGEDLTLQTGDITMWGNVGVSGQWSRQWQDRLRTEVLLAGSRYFSEYDRNSSLQSLIGAQQDSTGIARGLTMASEEDNEVNDLTFRMDTSWHLNRSHQIEFGVGLSWFDARYQSTLNDTIDIINRSDNAALYSGYIQDTWNTGQWEFTFGLRGSDYERSNGLHIEPRATLTYPLTDRIQFKGAWGQYTQFVNRIVNENVLEGSRDFWILADNELLPGTSEHFIAGLSYETDNWLLSAEAYRKDMDNLVEFTRRVRRQDEPGNYFFLGTGRAKGIEFLAQKKRGFLTGWVGYTLGRVEHQFPALNNGQAFPADHDRRHEINAVVRRTVGEWTFAATWTYATGRAYTAPESQYAIQLLNGEYLSYIHVSGMNDNRLPDYHRLDLSASRRYETEKWIYEVGVSFFNAYNHRNVWYREYQLDTTPITVTDALMLGFTPTVYIQLNFK